MHYRKLGKTNFEVSEVSLGAWQIGGAWGDVSDVDAERVLHAAIENGINFIRHRSMFMVMAAVSDLSCLTHGESSGS
jgi:predicted aldo/keto reductase-like oxidoreductase